ncbi:hypothetical protein EJ06DRAFT_49234 [Trichodelitschia bisporula]|uniref:Secreted protein n=1 Tax=Trichodelitschia bisporula TaxID=703511 RepID=A0A6G1HU44_9PEZI|nr:hypothetical protein EJ06DRAFT_49234 [Trichodelitschia bisporula]
MRSYDSIACLHALACCGALVEWSCGAEWAPCRAYTPPLSAKLAEIKPYPRQRGILKVADQHKHAGEEMNCCSNRGDFERAC